MNKQVRDNVLIPAAKVLAVGLATIAVQIIDRASKGEVHLPRRKHKDQRVIDADGYTIESK